jgi:hypothetical protein
MGSCGALTEAAMNQTTPTMQTTADADTKSLQLSLNCSAACNFTVTINGDGSVKLSTE